MLRVIREVHPTWIVGENVPGIVSMALDQVLSELADADYSVQSFNIPACAIDAPHRRSRIWIIAHSNNSRDRTSEYGINKKRSQKNQEQRKQSFDRISGCNQDVANTNKQGSQRHGRLQKRTKELPIGTRGGTKQANWLPEPNVGRVAHGIPHRVDRLKSLGNAIVPQCIVPIFEIIKKIS